MNSLITGGASGLGASITKALARDSSNKVYFTYNSSAAQAKVIESAYPNTQGIACDFRKEEDIDQLVSSIPSLEIDLLINNAYSGELFKTHFHKITASEFQTDFNNNILPCIKITQAAITFFRKKKQGKIITILTSFLAGNPAAGVSVYTANKAYMKELAKAWAYENGKYNITSNCVSPSFMQTAFTSDTDERMIEQIVQNHPLKKLLTPEEAAESVYFLANASSQINGIDLLLNSANIK